MTDFGDTVSEFLVNLVTKAQKRFHIFNFDKGYGLLKDYSRVYVTMDQTDLAIEEWQESVDVGYICALVFCGVMLAAFCIAPNVYWAINHFKKNRSLTQESADYVSQSHVDQFRKSKETEKLSLLL